MSLTDPARRSALTQFTTGDCVNGGACEHVNGFFGQLFWICRNLGRQPTGERRYNQSGGADLPQKRSPAGQVRHYVHLKVKP